MTRTQGPADRPPSGRDADGSERTALSWETLTERLIREAQEDGRFDDLPAHAQPLDLADDACAGELALAQHMLRNAGVAPPWIEIDKQVRAARSRIGALMARAHRSPSSAAARLVRELEALADADHDAVLRLDGLAPTARQQRQRLDRGLLRARLQAALRADRGAE